MSQNLLDEHKMVQGCWKVLLGGSWRATVWLGAALTILILLVNFTLLIWTGRTSAVIDGVATVFEGLITSPRCSESCPMMLKAPATALATSHSLHICSSTSLARFFSEQAITVLSRFVRRRATISTRHTQKVYGSTLACLVCEIYGRYHTGALCCGQCL